MKKKNASRDRSDSRKSVPNTKAFLFSSRADRIKARLEGTKLLEVGDVVVIAAGSLLLRCGQIDERLCLTTPEIR